MERTQLEKLVASRLEDLADQVSFLHTQGMPEEAEFLRSEGLELASAYDFGVTFLYLDDLRLSAND